MWPLLCTSFLHYFPIMSHHARSPWQLQWPLFYPCALPPMVCSPHGSQSDFVKLEVRSSHSSARDPSVLPVSFRVNLEVVPRPVRSPVTSSYYRLLFLPSVTLFQIHWPSCCSLNVKPACTPLNVLSLCLEGTFFTYSHSSRPHFLQISTQISFSILNSPHPPLFCSSFLCFTLLCSTYHPLTYADLFTEHLFPLTGPFIITMKTGTSSILFIGILYQAAASLTCLL